MSWPKEKCEVDCVFAKKDEAYDKPVCEYFGDIDEALVDNRIPKDCPWLNEAKKEGDKR